MAVQLNHTIVHARSSEESARFLSEILGLAPPGRFGPFFTVATENGVTLDFIDDDRGPIDPGHYAFLLSEAEFEVVFGRIRARGLTYWADPHKGQPGEINRHDGGRGVYFQDPSGHLLEIITRPYGSATA